MINLKYRSENDTELKHIYRKEEFNTEKRINRVFLIVFSFLFIFLIILNLSTSIGFKNMNSVSNFGGILIFLIYNLFIYYLLKKRIYHPAIKYITITFTITIISLVLYGYHFGIDFVHSVRTVTVTSYFIAIILSGLYQHPRLSLYAGFMAGLQYSFLCVGAFSEGIPILTGLETFQRNVLTWDILIVYIVFLFGAGVLMFLNSRRQQFLVLELRKSLRKLHREEEKAVYFEKYDELTRLPNLKYFREYLGGQIKKAETRKQIFAMMCVGLDSFHNINQLHGKDTGDQLLQKVGDRLKSAYREGDFICRFMGDKFLILFSDLKSDYNITDLIKKTRSAFEKPFDGAGSEIKLSISGGLCSYPEDAAEIDDLINKAESTMYGAKTAGKNNFFLFNKSNQEEFEQRIRIEKELEDALVNNELNLVYQPKVDADGRIIGLESLLRWDSKALGNMRPDVFIPIAERSGMIIPIGYEIFRICCLQIKEWSGQGIGKVRITVNVSPNQFIRENFVKNVCEIINETGIDPSWLGIEVTESGIMKNEAECIRKLNLFSELGMSISIDDFGKGYSSLSRLGSYPLDTLKIDKAFVDDLPDSKVSCCLVRSVIDLAHNLSYNVIAEGVESIEQINFLKQSGCTRFQGYYYYKPLPAEDVTKLLKKG